MKPRSMLILLVVMGLIFGAGANAFGFTLDIANVPKAYLEFKGGSHPYFDFPNAASGVDAGYSFVITGFDSAFGDSVGLLGTISGQYYIGTVHTSGSLKYAAVTGTGVLDINDGHGKNLTADIAWEDIYTYTPGSSSSGGMNLAGDANVTSVSYSGLNFDLRTFTGYIDQTATLSFAFASSSPVKTLSYLTAATTTKDSYAGQLSAVYNPFFPPVPLPPSALLLGSGLVGLLALKMRKS